MHRRHSLLADRRLAKPGPSYSSCHHDRGLGIYQLARAVARPRAKTARRRHIPVDQPIPDQRCRFKSGDQVRNVPTKARTGSVASTRQSPRRRINAQRVLGSHSGAGRLTSHTSDTWHPRPFPPRPFSVCHVKSSDPDLVASAGRSNSSGIISRGLSKSGWTSIDSPATSRTFT